MSKLTRRQLAEVLVKNLGTDKQKETVTAVATHLYHNGGGKDVELLIKDVELLVEKQQYHTVAHVTSARKLDSATLAQVVAEIKKLTGSASVEAIESVDPSLLGGVVATTPEMELDLTLQGKLARLKG